MHTRFRPLFALLLAVVLVAASCGDDNGDDNGSATSAPGDTAGAGTNDIQLSVASPTPGSEVEGNVVDLEVDFDGFELIAADGDSSGRTGHLHVFINRPAMEAGETIPVEAGIVHSAVNPVRLTGLPVGEHEFIVVAGDGVHRRIGRAEARTTVKVLGPSVRATAPATVAAGEPFSVTVEVDGVELATADGDTSGRTGHLHFFIDRDPTPAGQPIPIGEPDIVHSPQATVELPAFTESGPHTVWVVLGDGAHVPFDPPVMHRLSITVS